MKNYGPNTASERSCLHGFGAQFEYLTALRWNDDEMTLDELLDYYSPLPQQNSGVRQRETRKIVQLIQEGYIQAQGDQSGAHLHVSLTEEGKRLVDALTEIIADIHLTQWQPVSANLSRMAS